MMGERRRLITSYTNKSRRKRHYKGSKQRRNKKKSVESFVGKNSLKNWPKVKYYDRREIRGS